MRLPKGLRRIQAPVEDSPIWQRFRRNLSISVLGSGFSLLLKLGQTAILTKVMMIDDYGRLLIVLNFFVFLDSFFGLRVSDLVFRFFPQFREQQETRALKGLLVLCLGICLISGVVIYGSVVVAAPWLADRFYPNLGLTPLFNIYGWTLLVTAFSGVYEPILRIHDRFSSIVVPQVLGSLVTFACLSVYLLAFRAGSSVSGGYSLKVIVGTFAAGALVQSLPPFLQALRLVKPFLLKVRTAEAIKAIAAHRPAVVGCLLNSNFSGYLKFAISPGDMFLLGLFSSPTQLALYGLARQITAPFGLLQSNIQTAITPEITSLVAGGKFDQLKRLLSRYAWWTFVLASLLLVVALFLGRIFILTFTQPEFVAALPVFYALAVAAWLMLVFVVFRPLALALDMLRWHNLALLTSAGIVVGFIVAGRLNALTMAFIQLVEVLVLRSIFGFLVWTRLKRLATKD